MVFWIPAHRRQRKDRAVTMLIVALTEDFSASGFEFLMTDVSIGLTFADIALGAGD
jgi:hypothetical protein